MNVNLYEMIQELKMATGITVTALIPLGAVVMAAFTASVVRTFFKMRKEEEASAAEKPTYEEIL